MTAPTLTHDSVATALNDLLGTEVDDLVALRPGAWSSAWAFTHTGHPLVARFSAVDDDFDCDAFAPRFANSDLPIPTVTHRGRWGDLYLAISERVDGSFLDDLDADPLQRALPSLISAMEALRLADTRESHGYGGWNADGNGKFATWPDALRAGLEDRLDGRGAGWRAKLMASLPGAAAFDRDLAILERLLDDLPAYRHVIHADLINYNCFVAADRISGVIDWGCAMYGDHLYEVAWFEFWSPWYPQWAALDMTGAMMRAFEASGADMTNAAERLTCYLLHIGLGHQAYNASIGNMDGLVEVIERTTQVADKVR